MVDQYNIENAFKEVKRFKESTKENSWKVKKSQGELETQHSTS